MALPGTDLHHLDEAYARARVMAKETTVFIVNIDSGWDELVYGKWRERPSREETAIAQDQAESPATPHPQHLAR